MPWNDLCWSEILFVLYGYCELSYVYYWIELCVLRVDGMYEQYARFGGS